MTVEYNKNNLFWTLLHWKGSVIPRIYTQLILTIGITVAAVLVREECSPIQRGLRNDTNISFVVVPVAFLLIFRTNIAYDRYWQGRVLIDSMVYHAMCLVHKLVLFSDLNSEPNTEESQELRIFRRCSTRLVNLLVDVISQSLEDSDASVQVSKYCSQEEKRLLELCRGPKAIAVSAWVSRVLNAGYRRGYVDDPVLHDCEEHLYMLVDAYMAGQKIKSCPLPFPYVQMLNIGLFIVVNLLPFSFAVDYKWITVVICGLIALAFFGINSAGVEIQDPFGTDLNDFQLFDFALHVYESSKNTWRIHHPDASEAPLLEVENSMMEVLQRLHCCWVGEEKVSWPPPIPSETDDTDKEYPPPALFHGVPRSINPLYNSADPTTGKRKEGDDGRHTIATQTSKRDAESPRSPHPTPSSGANKADASTNTLSSKGHSTTPHRRRADARSHSRALARGEVPGEPSPTSSPTQHAHASPSYQYVVSTRQNTAANAESVELSYVARGVRGTAPPYPFGPFPPGHPAYNIAAASGSGPTPPPESDVAEGEVYFEVGDEGGTPAAATAQ